MVAVPTLMTAEVFTPARIKGSASGISMCRSRSRAGSPSASAACRIPAPMPSKPACVLRTIGRSAYRNSAISAGHVPIVPTSAMRKANSASDGMVWITPTTPRIGCAAQRSFAAATPSGTPSATLAASETKTSSRCSPVRRRKSGPNKAPRKLRCPARTVPPPDSSSLAASAKLFPSSSAAAFMRIIFLSSIRPASFSSSRQASGNRFGTSSRWSSTAS